MRTLSGEEALLLDVEFEFVVDSLRFDLRGTVSNRSDTEVRDVLFAFTPSIPVAADHASYTQAVVVGSGPEALVVSVADSLGAGEAAAFTFVGDILAKDEVSFALLRLGIGADGKSRALDRETTVVLEPDIRASLNVRVAGALEGNAILRLDVAALGVGRNSIRGATIDLVLPDDIILVQPGSKPKRGVASGGLTLAMGDERKVVFFVASSGISDSCKRELTCRLRVGDQVIVSESFVLDVIVEPMIDIASILDEPSWVRGQTHSVSVEVSNRGTGSAHDVEIVVDPVGGAKATIGVGARGTSTLKKGKRLLRTRFAAISPGETKKFKLLVFVPEQVGHIPPGLSITDGKTTHVQAIDVGYVPSWGPDTGFDAFSEIVGPGEIVRVPFRLCNVGSTTVVDAGIEFALDERLNVVGFDDDTVEFNGATYRAGNVPPGYAHQNALLIRVAGLTPGEHDLTIGGEIFSSNVYGFDMPQVMLTARAAALLEMDVVDAGDGILKIHLGNVGDAIATGICLTLSLPDDVSVHERSTIVSSGGEEGVVLADTMGISVLLGEGVVFEELDPGFAVDVRVRLGAKEASAFSVFARASAAGETLEAQCIIAVPEDEQLTHVGEGYRLGSSVVAIVDTDIERENTAEQLHEQREHRVNDDLDLRYGVVDDGVSRHAIVDVDSSASGAPADVSHEHPPIVKIVSGSDLHVPVRPDTEAFVDATDSRGLPVAAFDPAMARASAAAPLSVVPAVLRPSDSWYRGVLKTLEPIIQSQQREMSLHILAIRLFLPDRFVGTISTDRVEDVEVAIAQLQRVAKTETLFAVSVLGVTGAMKAESWLRRVGSNEIQNAARAFAKAIAGTAFHASSETPTGIWALVDQAGMRSIEKRFSMDDSLATVWTFLSMFPTYSDDEGLTHALRTYRELLERSLYSMSLENGMREEPSIELDDALTSLADALRSVSERTRSVGVG